MGNTITNKRKKTYSAGEKAALLAAYKASGLSKKEWCQDNAIALSTLQRWLQHEKKQDQPQPVQNWVSVIQAGPKRSASLDIQIGKCKIAVDTKTDKTLLAAVLGVLVEVC